MMKRTILYTLYIYVAALTLASCVADIEPMPKGWLHVAPPTKDSTTITRSGDQIDYLVSIKKDENMIMSPIRYSQIQGPISLSAGTDYTLLAESCTKTEAEAQPSIYGQPRYAGNVLFDIEANKSKTIKVSCSMANAAFQVVKDASFYYESFIVTATLNNRTLMFTDEEQMGYFNVGNEGTALLSYQVEATDSEGKTGKGSGTIELKAKTLSRLHLKGSDLGYIGISVTYDDTFTPTVTNVVVTP
ncbi:MAG: DUF4493 domain-containing protein [Bacteroidaceae bacterium]|nr:DUF4493 domain-containing protein [Bacteroidaceae bacterium]